MRLKKTANQISKSMLRSVCGEARLARKRLDGVWPYVWMSFAPVVILGVALAIVSYRIGVQSCHQGRD